MAKVIPELRSMNKDFPRLIQEQMFLIVSFTSSLKTSVYASLVLRQSLDYAVISWEMDLCLLTNLVRFHHSLFVFQHPGQL